MNIRKDAITPYEDYNALEAETTIDLSFKSAGSSSDISEEGENHNNKYLHEECPPPYASSLMEEEFLKPATLEVTLHKVDETVDDPASWKQKAERDKRQIDFFENTLDVRKNAIESYSDYKKIPLKSNSESDSDADEDEEDDDSEHDTVCDSSDEDDESVGQVSSCPECGDRNIRRNAKLERIAQIFKKMMEFRDLL